LLGTTAVLVSPDGLELAAVAAATAGSFFFATAFFFFDSFFLVSFFGAFFLSFGGSTAGFPSVSTRVPAESNDVRALGMGGAAPAGF